MEEEARVTQYARSPKRKKERKKKPANEWRERGKWSAKQTSQPASAEHL